MGYTKNGLPKAKMIKDLYRNPKFKGGACCVCRKRPRNYIHPKYPHMCEQCLRTRIAIDDQPIATREVMSAQARIDRELLEQHLMHNKQLSIQTLNDPTNIPPTRTMAIAAISKSASRFRAYITANPITNEQRKRIAESAERFRATVAAKRNSDVVK